MAKKNKKYSKKGGSGKTKAAGGMLGAALYGAVRARLSNALAQYTNKIPLGNISDEVGMLIVNYAAEKFVGNKFPIVRDMTKAGNLIEYARIGEAIATGNLGGITTQSTNGGTQLVIG